MYVLSTYLAYLAISIAVTIWVARTLHRNGRAFLVEAFHGHEVLADSINHLLVVGFYLINLGWIVMTLRTRYELDTARAAIELLSDKIGTVLFVLGLMHFFNLFLFSRFRRRALDRIADARPPLPPTGFLRPQEEAR
jgi:energy-converting hydrogenase Eha subunit C